MLEVIGAVLLGALMLNAHWSRIREALHMSTARNVTVPGLGLVYWQAIHFDNTLAVWVEVNYETKIRFNI